jgi:hypothetical protein
MNRIVASAQGRARMRVIRFAVFLVDQISVEWSTKFDDSLEDFVA